VNPSIVMETGCRHLPTLKLIGKGGRGQRVGIRKGRDTIQNQVDPMALIQSVTGIGHHARTLKTKEKEKGGQRASIGERRVTARSQVDPRAPTWSVMEIDHHLLILKMIEREREAQGESISTRRDPIWNQVEITALIQSAMHIDLLLILKSTGKERGGQREREKRRRDGILKAPIWIPTIGREDVDILSIA